MPKSIFTTEKTHQFYDFGIIEKVLEVQEAKLNDDSVVNKAANLNYNISEQKTTLPTKLNSGIGNTKLEKIEISTSKPSATIGGKTISNSGDKLGEINSKDSEGTYTFFQILWKSRCHIFVTFPSHLKKLRSILRF